VAVLEKMKKIKHFQIILITGFTLSS